MSLLWKTATAMTDDDRLSLDEGHAHHAPHPAIAEVGWGHSPCASVGCPEYDKDHDDAMERAYDAKSKGRFRLIDGKTEGLHGYESHIDSDTVTAYRAATPPKKHLPHIFVHKGKTHILDGHHRLLADTLEGRKTPVLHTDLDEER